MAAYNEIRGVMIPVSGGKVLLPNSVVSEIINYPTPAALISEYPWILGRFPWRGWMIPVSSFGRMAEMVEEEETDATRVVVLKALMGNTNLPFHAIICRGMPEQVTVNEENTQVLEDGKKGPGVAGTVIVDEKEAVIPDLQYLEVALSEAMRQ